MMSKVSSMEPNSGPEWCLLVGGKRGISTSAPERQNIGRHIRGSGIGTFLHEHMISGLRHYGSLDHKKIISWWRSTRFSVDAA